MKVLEQVTGEMETEQLAAKYRGYVEGGTCTAEDGLASALVEWLTTGDQPAVAAKRLAELMDAPPSLLRRLKRKLGIQSYRKAGAWFWHFPPPEDDEEPTFRNIVWQAVRGDWLEERQRYRQGKMQAVS